MYARVSAALIVDGRTPVFALGEGPTFTRVLDVSDLAIRYAVRRPLGHRRHRGPIYGGAISEAASDRLVFGALGVAAEAWMWRHRSADASLSADAVRSDAP
jgi:hypothetical protein